MNTYIVIGTILISLLAEFNRPLKQRLLFNAYAIRHHGEWWRLFTGGFVHSDFNSGMGPAHLAFNMFALWTFGGPVEEFFQMLVHDSRTGSLIYLAFYIVAIPMSSLYSYEKHKDDIWYNALGASGAVSAVMFNYLLQYPFQWFIWPPLPGIAIGAIYLGVSWYMARRGTDNIGHDAHFFGALFGLLVTLISAPHLAENLLQVDQLFRR